MLKRLKGRYIKPHSLTWWASFVPLGLGIFVAALPLHGWSDGVMFINNMTNGQSAYDLINFGLVGIGLRGAIE